MNLLIARRTFETRRWVSVRTDAALTRDITTHDGLLTVVEPSRSLLWRRSLEKWLENGL